MGFLLGWEEGERLKFIWEEFWRGGVRGEELEFGVFLRGEEVGKR